MGKRKRRNVLPYSPKAKKIGPSLPDNDSTVIFRHPCPSIATGGGPESGGRIKAQMPVVAGPKPGNALALLQMSYSDSSSDEAENEESKLERQTREQMPSTQLESKSEPGKVQGPPQVKEPQEIGPLQQQQSEQSSVRHSLSIGQLLVHLQSCEGETHMEHDAECEVSGDKSADQSHLEEAIESATTGGTRNRNEQNYVLPSRMDTHRPIIIPQAKDIESKGFTANDEQKGGYYCYGIPEEEDNGGVIAENREINGGPHAEQQNPSVIDNQRCIITQALDVAEQGLSEDTKHESGFSAIPLSEEDEGSQNRNKRMDAVQNTNVHKYRMGNQGSSVALAINSEETGLYDDMEHESGYIILPQSDEDEQVQNADEHMDHDQQLVLQNSRMDNYMEDSVSQTLDMNGNEIHRDRVNERSCILIPGSVKDVGETEGNVNEGNQHQYGVESIMDIEQTNVEVLKKGWISGDVANEGRCLIIPGPNEDETSKSMNEQTDGDQQQILQEFNMEHQESSPAVQAIDLNEKGTTGDTMTLGESFVASMQDNYYPGMNENKKTDDDQQQEPIGSIEDIQESGIAARALDIKEKGMFMDRKQEGGCPFKDGLDENGNVINNVGMGTESADDSCDLPQQNKIIPDSSDRRDGPEEAVTKEGDEEGGYRPGMLHGERVPAELWEDDWLFSEIDEQWIKSREIPEVRLVCIGKKRKPNQSLPLLLAAENTQELGHHRQVSSNSFSRPLELPKLQLPLYDEIKTSDGLQEESPDENNVGHLQSNSKCETIRERKVVIRTDQPVRWNHDENGNLSPQCDVIQDVKYSALDFISNQSTQGDADMVCATCGCDDIRQEAIKDFPSDERESLDRDDIDVTDTYETAKQLFVTFKQHPQVDLGDIDTLPMLKFEQDEDADVLLPSDDLQEMMMKDERKALDDEDLYQELPPDPCGENRKEHSPCEDAMSLLVPAHPDNHLKLFVGLLNELQEDLKASASLQEDLDGFGEDSYGTDLNCISSPEPIETGECTEIKLGSDVDHSDVDGDDKAVSEHCSHSKLGADSYNDVLLGSDEEMMPQSPFSDPGQEDCCSRSTTPTSKSPEPISDPESSKLPDVLKQVLSAGPTSEMGKEDDAISLVCDTEDLMATLEDLEVQETDSPQLNQNKSKSAEEEIANVETTEPKTKSAVVEKSSRTNDESSKWKSTKQDRPKPAVSPPTKGHRSPPYARSGRRFGPSLARSPPRYRPRPIPGSRFGPRGKSHVGWPRKIPITRRGFVRDEYVPSNNGRRRRSRETDWSWSRDDLIGRRGYDTDDDGPYHDSPKRNFIVSQKRDRCFCWSRERFGSRTNYDEEHYIRDYILNEDLEDGRISVHSRADETRFVCSFTDSARSGIDGVHNRSGGDSQIPQIGNFQPAPLHQRLRNSPYAELQQMIRNGPTFRSAHQLQQLQQQHQEQHQLHQQQQQHQLHQQQQQHQLHQQQQQHQLHQQQQQHQLHQHQQQQQLQQQHHQQQLHQHQQKLLQEQHNLQQLPLPLRLRLGATVNRQAVNCAQEEAAAAMLSKPQQQQAMVETIVQLYQSQKESQVTMEKQSRIIHHYQRALLVAKKGSPALSLNAGGEEIRERSDARPFPSEEQRRSSPNQERTVWRTPVRITWDRQDSEGSERRSRSRSPVTLEQLDQRRGAGQDISVCRERETHFQRERHYSTDSHSRSPRDGGEQRGFVPFNSTQRERVCFSENISSERHILLKRNAELPDPRISPVNHEGYLDRIAPEGRNSPRGPFQDEVGQRRSRSPDNVRARERDYPPRPRSCDSFGGRSRSPTPDGRTLLLGNRPRFSSHKSQLNSRVTREQENGPVVDYNHVEYRESPVHMQHRGHPNAPAMNEESLARGHPGCGNNAPRGCVPWRQGDFGMREQLGPRRWNPFRMRASAGNFPPPTFNAPHPQQAFRQHWRAQACPRVFQGILGPFPRVNLRPRMPFHQGPRRFPLGPNHITRFPNNGRLPPGSRDVYDAEWNDDFDVH